MRAFTMVLGMVFFVAVTSVADAGRNRGGGGGRLGRVGKSLRQSHSASGSSSSGGSSGSAATSSHSTTNSHAERRRHRYGGEYLSGPRPRYELGLPNVRLTPVTFDLYGGAQKVVESDKAFGGAARVRFGNFGIGGELTRYQEPSALPEMGVLTLHTWSVTASYKIKIGPRVAIEPEAGGAGLRFAGDGMPPLVEGGVVAGLRLRVGIADGTALFGVPRVYAFDGGNGAIEGRAGIAVGPLELSYRYLKYEDAPSLEGPEVGGRFVF